MTAAPDTPPARGPASDVPVTLELARALLADQHPDLADLPIVHVEDGWDNSVMRLGDDLALRLPRRAAGAWLILIEQTWLPRIGPTLPLPTPIPVRTGVAALGYPYAWSVVPWLAGEMACEAPLGPDQGEALAGFLKALHQPAPEDAPRNPFRGVPLADREAAFEERLALVERRSGPLGAGVRRTWAEGLAAPIDLPRTWLHGDPHGRNVLTRDARLAAVIDWGDMAAGDAASDLASVWMLLDGVDTRERALAAYGISPATLVRARGWAVMMGVMMQAGDARMTGMGADILRRLEEGP
jgi:aminoglycoside phosphotransferase (APT) family kinase protein